MQKEYWIPQHDNRDLFNNPVDSPQTENPIEVNSKRIILQNNRQQFHLFVLLSTMVEL